MKPENLLFIGPYPPIYGGYSTQIFHLSSFLVKRGCNVTVLSFEKEDKEEFVNGLRVIRAKKRKKFFKIFSRFGNIGIFSSLLRQGFRLREIFSIIIEYCVVCDIVRSDSIRLAVTYNLYESMFVPLLKNKYGNELTIFTMVFAEVIQDISIKDRCHGYLNSVLLSADQVISSSKYCAGLYENFGIDPHLIKVIYVGVDVVEFSPDVDDSPVSLPLDLPPNDSIVLFLGRFLRDMGLDVILDAIPVVLEKNDNVSFLLAGAHGELDTEAKILQQKYPGKVFIAHNIPNSVLPAYYRRCTILVAPTKGLRACMGLSIKEAMACAKPAIVSDSGGIVEAVVPGETGMIIPLRGQVRISPNELAGELLMLLGSPELLGDMGRAARERALALFDKNVEAERWLGLMCGLTHDNCE